MVVISPTVILYLPPIRILALLCRLQKRLVQESESVLVRHQLIPLTDGLVVSLVERDMNLVVLVVGLGEEGFD